MPTLLHLDSSPLETSVSRELTREFAAAWRTSHPDGTVLYRNLSIHPLAPVDAAWIAASFTPPAARQPEQTALLATSEELIGELEAADEYVFGVPMHNFSIPSVLKLWIDQVVRSGRTFSYGASGPVGLLRGKRATVLAASGGVYEQGTPMGALNFVEPYLATVLGFLGVSDVRFVTAGGAAQLMSGKVDRESFLQNPLAQVRAVAA